MRIGIVIFIPIMEINLGSLKIERAVTVTFYVMSVLLPLPFGLLIYDSSIFLKMDIFKLILMSISTTGCLILFNFIFNIMILSFIKAISIVLNEHKENGKEKKSIENNTSVESERKKDVTGELALYLTFFLSDFAACITILNLLRLKYYLHINPKYFINASIDTYSLICLIWYSIFLLIFIILNIGLYYVVKQKVTENKLAFYLMRAFLEQEKKQKTSPIVEQ